MDQLQLVPPAVSDPARHADESVSAWVKRRHCAVCACLAVAESSPEIPHNLEPVLYSFDDPMIQGPHRDIALFACSSCGRRWAFNAAYSDWTLQP